ncbi:bifunctional phosphoribosylaminoimidazolecarboxamide formyltransferase/IMP cyclohydrolase [Entomobacter blattae]|uniref:Bifunctional purine biosynthesis protein PurH n=1 Tax=Entomobacter blattae TaxID=2762277 RepID=A0A7H1NPS1_9PROT|nr:bifunctional phosphoribosylaminoimidazolecarboxamide formyltransferase/IMP cyclohydrolase [Entomobacter blattae]QNT77781.1 Bifunctional purine biosynthesis protein PurH [Entomobacter blattae]
MSQAVKPIQRALISVSDKTGLIELAQALVENQCEILSTGGSARVLREAGIAVKDVSDHTGFPEILDGRVKTLVPQIHGGILGQRANTHHIQQMKEHNISPIDLVCVNLYPFEQTVLSGAGKEECIENIDIGGPALIRAAAKNHEDVVVLTEPAQYKEFLEIFTSSYGTTLAQRRQWAGKAYAFTALYDATIAEWFAKGQHDDELPKTLFIHAQREHLLRYGENPHQKAAFYRKSAFSFGVASARQLQGKELSYNNINDTNAAFEAVAEFDEPAVVVVKHANPCGVAVSHSLLSAWELAYRCDPVSAFGGIVATNRSLDEKTALSLSEIFTEVVIAPDITEEAQAVLQKKKNLRVLVTGGMPDPARTDRVLHSVSGGFLLQSQDNGIVGEDDLKTVTKRKPTLQEVQDMLFAFKVCKHVKSNAIVYAKDKATVGIGAGQMSRVDSVRIALNKSREVSSKLHLPDPLTKGSVVASDAFFPFADGVMTAIEAGATAIIQPGGSIRDQEVIDAANKANLAMVFTGMRHFRH